MIKCKDGPCTGKYVDEVKLGQRWPDILFWEYGHKYITIGYYNLEGNSYFWEGILEDVYCPKLGGNK